MGNSPKEATLHPKRSMPSTNERGTQGGQPPVPRRLLGIGRFETYFGDVEARTDRHMGHLRRYQSGENVQWN